MSKILDLGATDNRQDLHQWALILRGWGFSVFALTAKKTPLVRWGFYQKRRADDLQLGRMFAKDGVGGIGIVCGRVSGHDGAALCVRDFDELDAYDDWRSRNAALAADAPTTITNRGRHVWVFVRGGAAYQRLGDGELISDRHYVVAPPSRHPKGGKYLWRDGPPLGIRDFPIVTLSHTGFLQDLPGWKRGRSRQEEAGGGPEEEEKKTNGLCPVPVHAEPTSHAIRQVVLRTQPHREGERNDKLLYLARSLKDINPDAHARDLYPVVAEWLRRAQREIGPRDWDETWNDFRWAWSRASVPISLSRPMSALREGAAIAKEGPRARLMAACRGLADETGGAFHLAVRTAGKVVGLGKSQAHELIKSLVEDGSLIVVQPGTRGSTLRKAAVYRLGGSP